MKKIRFIIVGSGWRSLYYVRVAKALPERFELCAMLCRTPGKAEKLATEQNIYTTTSIEECRGMKPDFVVVAVNKSSIAQVSKEWMEYGFTVLCETPAALTLPELEELWKLHDSGRKLVVAEQYIHYPRYHAMLEMLNQNIIGEPDCINISLAHDYHGASLIKAFLRENAGTPFTVSAKTYSFPVVETLNRYERFTDGRIKYQTRTVATFEFADGKVAWYDFNSEQYRSPIRKNHVKIEGRRGQLMDEEIFYLDENYIGQKGRFQFIENLVATGDPNPNLCEVREVEKIIFETETSENEGRAGEDSGRTNGNKTDANYDRTVYETYFGPCGLGEDETAIAKLMLDTWEYAKHPSDEILQRQKNALKSSLQDVYMAMLMQEAVETGKTVHSREQIWQR